MDANAEYLRKAVGDVLSKGIAATTLAQPNDPVDFLATWLIKHVEGKRAEEEYLQQKQAAKEEQQQAEAERIKAVRAAEEVAATLQADLESLSLLRGEPVLIWRAAADLVQRHTSAGAAYMAQVLDPAEPEWAAPPAEEDEAAGAETDDDEAAVKAEGEEAEAEAEAAPEAEAAAEGEEGGPKVQLPQQTDYSCKALAYVAATHRQEWLVGRQLHRPKAATEEEEGEEGARAARPPVPVTFRLLDEQVPLLHVPVVAREPRITFFKPFPKIGAYLAAALRDPKGDYVSILAADSLIPGGHGQAFSPEEQDLLERVAQVAAQAVADSQAALQADLQAAAAGLPDTAALQAELDQLHKDSREAAAAAAPKAEGEEGEEAAEEAAEAGEEGDDAVAAAAALVARLTSQVAALEGEVGRGKGSVAACTGALEVQQAALAAVNKALEAGRAVGTKALRSSLVLPQATYHLLKAVLLLLGRQPASYDTWPKAQALVGPELFTALAAYDAQAARDMAVWGKVRACYKAVKGGPAALEAELAPSRLGLLLLLWLKEVRRSAKRAAALRAAQAALQAVEQQLAAKSTELEAGKAAHAKAEEEAAAAAAAAAAAEAAAAAAEAEEQGQEDE